MRYFKWTYFFLNINFILFLSAVSISAQSVDIKGQLSGWSYFTDLISESQGGIRYIPSISLIRPIGHDHNVDMETAFNIYTSGFYSSGRSFTKNTLINEYRLWIRYSNNQLEVRAGLQKINFGSAMLLRPMRWFDEIDPRDPLQLTMGVYGILGRYYFLNNANIWLWALYGNDELKGWELFPSSDNSVEYGGRLQYPLGSGEMAVSFHRRKMKSSLIKQNINILKTNSIPETRFALDGKWDLGIGLWFESVLIHQSIINTELKYQQFFLSGIDYTFGLGSGLHLLGEHLNFSSGKKLNKWNNSENISAMLMRYNIGLLDQVSAIFYYDWGNENLFKYIQWGRLYDNWSLYANLFWNPEKSQMSFQSANQNKIGVGNGIQLMVVFNH